MGSFRYQAIDAGGRVVRGVLTADDQLAARDYLRTNGLRVFQLRERSGSTGIRLKIPGFKADQTSVDAALRDVATVLSAGGTLTEALSATAAQQKRDAVRCLFDRLRADVDRGCSLGEAMELDSDRFSSVCIGLVKAGEQSGSLAESLEEYAAMSERWARLRGRLAGAIIYPCIVTVTGVGVAVFLSTSVLPEIIDLLADTGRELPAVTRAVLFGSHMVSNWWHVGLGIVMLMAVLLGRLMKIGRVRYRFDSAVLRVPGVGPLIMTQEVVRAASVTGGLLKGGLVLTDALTHAAETATTKPIQRTLRESVRKIANGQDAAGVFESSALPAVVAQVFAIGQRSGQLETMLARLADDYDRRLDRAVQRLMAIMEPTLILVLALLVGTIAMAVLLPILEAGDVL